MKINIIKKDTCTPAITDIKLPCMVRYNCTGAYWLVLADARSSADVVWVRIYENGIGSAVSSKDRDRGDKNIEKRAELVEAINEGEYTIIDNWELTITDDAKG